MSSQSSSDEGEIRDGIKSVEKATTSLTQYDDTSVDRQDRTRSRQSSSIAPDRDSRARHRRPRDRSVSPRPGWQPRGSKRSRDEDYSDRNRADPRRFRVHYEGDYEEYNRHPRVSYDAIDYGSSALKYDERDRYSQKRPRTRSRSPYKAERSYERDNSGRSSRTGEQRNDAYRDGVRSRHNGYEDARGLGKDLSVSKRANSPLPADRARYEAKTMQGSSQQHDSHALTKNSLAIDADHVAKDEADTVEPKFLDVAALIEQRRKRREAIRAKYRGSATPLLVQALQLGDKSGDSSPGNAQNQETDGSRRSTSPFMSAPNKPNYGQDPASPSAFSVNDDQDLANTNGQVNDADDDGPSAADYDPTADMQEDKQRDSKRTVVTDMPSASYDETQRTTEQDVLIPAKMTSEDDKPKKAKNDFDMFADDDDDDMFAEESSRAEKRSLNTDDDLAKAGPIPQAKVLDVGMLDNWDDAEGYYKIILGEKLDNRYHVQANLGKGMFSGVVRATDITTNKLVAIKLIRKNETMRKAGMKEIDILQKINNADPDDKKHMIRLLRQFEHKGHLCMVFENLSINLREVLKKFGRDVGINLRAVRAYAQQMFLGLSLLRKCNILHADLKPDNILVNDSRNMLKICDLGSASDATENEITPYLVSRFYRAPEIILGMEYDYAIDIWSIGCTLYEMYTGKILFTGRTNNQMLRSIMDCRGKFTVKMLKRAKLAHIHFDDMANFKSVEQEKISGKDIVKTLTFTKPSRDLRTRLLAASKGMNDVDMKELMLFTDLLDRCLALNPEKRCTPTEALKHPFISRSMR